MSQTDDPSLSELEEQWRSGRNAGALLHLTEEYRKRGLLDQAIETLEEGLAILPGRIAPRIALGRCRLARGETRTAITLLEQVLDRDPMQLVASKLLVEAYLTEGDLDKARARLEVYTTLNPGDPAIEALTARLESPEDSAPVDRVPPIPDTPGGPLSFPPAADAGMSLISEEETEPRTPPEPGVAGRAGGAPGPGSADVAETPTEGEVPLTDILAPPAPGAPPTEPETSQQADQELFAVPSAPTSASEYWSALVAGGPFDGLAPRAEGGSPSPVSPREPEAPGRLSQSPESKPEEVEADAADLPLSGPERKAGVETGGAESEPGAGPAAAEPTGPRAPAEATVTLGRLYLDQGHLAEAARTYRQVLELEPTHQAAQAGMTEIASRRRRGLEVKDLLADGGTAGSAAAVLERYLALVVGRS